ncbi:MAG: hypothetical protein RL095_2049 [Verrucomicrobiota bacterium]
MKFLSLTIENTELGNLALSLRAVSADLDRMWIYNNGNGLDCPLDNAFLAELEACTAENETHGFTFKPGFFSKYGHTLYFPWGQIFAVDATAYPEREIEEMNSLADWFRPLPETLNRVSFVARNVDDSIIVMGFRDESLYARVKCDFLKRNISFYEINYDDQGGK